MKIILVRLLTICTLACSVFPAGETGTPSGMSARVYGQMDEEGGIVANLVQGSKFTILGTETDADGNKWCHIRTDFGTEGYILEADVKRTTGEVPSEESGQPEPDVYYIQTTGNANVREQPSLEAAVVGQIPAGTELEPLEIQENDEGQVWYRIGYGGMDGYISELAVNKVDGENTDPDPTAGQDGNVDDGSQAAQGGQQDGTEEPGTAQGEPNGQGNEGMDGLEGSQGEPKDGENDSQGAGITQGKTDDQKTAGSAETTKPDADKEDQKGQQEQQDVEKDAGRETETAKSGSRVDKTVILLAAGILISGAATAFIIRLIQKEQGKITRNKEGKKADRKEQRK